MDAPKKNKAKLGYMTIGPTLPKCLALIHAQSCMINEVLCRSDPWEHRKLAIDACLEIIRDTSQTAMDLLKSIKPPG